MQALQRVSLIPCHCCIRFTNTKGTHSPGGSCLAPSPPCFGAATLCVVPCYGVALLHPDGWPTLTGKAAILSTQSLSCAFQLQKLDRLGLPRSSPLPRISCCIFAPYVRTALAYHGRPLLWPLQRQSSRAQCYALASADSPSLIYVRLIECLPPF